MKDYKKIISITLLILFCFSFFVLFNSKEAKAQSPNPMAAISVPIFETSSAVVEPKEGLFGSGFGLDWLGYTMAKLALSAMTNSIVNWINSGFEGNPTFISNPSSYFKDLADQATSVFIQQLGMEGILCSQFRPQIVASLKYNYKSPSMQKFQCTLDSAIDNWEDFMNDFTAGGWKGWLSVSTQPQNNPYGSYLMALDEMDARISAKVSAGQQEVAWGSGFTSLKECAGGKSQADTCIDICDNSTENYGEEDEGWNQCHEECMTDQMNTTELCEMSGGKMQNTTPGAIIADQLKLNLGSSVRQMELADEISESLTAVFNALINQLITKGVSSLSNSNGGGGSGSWYQSQPTSKERTNSVKLIDTMIKTENEYKSYKQKSLNKYNWAISKTNDLIACYQADPTMQSVISAKLIPLKNSLELQKQVFEIAIWDSSQLITQAQDLKIQISNSSTYEDLSSFFKVFEDDLQPYMHNSGDASDAQEEYEKIIKPALDDIINGHNGIQDLLDSC
ncbi:hypothetical protein KJ763_00255 [Patescibacteria group bacterium]|nr:hypothetical protein [Patescibacteria group bacterium]